MSLPMRDSPTFVGKWDFKSLSMFSLVGSALYLIPNSQETQYIIIIRFRPELYLDPNMQNYIALHSINMLYTWHNMSWKFGNNIIKYSHNGGHGRRRTKNFGGLYTSRISHCSFRQFALVKRISAQLGGLQPSLPPTSYAYDGCTTWTTI